MVKNEAPFFGYTTFHNQPIVLYRKRVGRFLFVVKTAELLNIFLIVLMALFLNAQGCAEFPGFKKGDGVAVKKGDRVEITRL